MGSGTIAPLKRKMPTETALETIEQQNPQPIQQIVRHIRILTLATTEELEAAKAKIPGEDIVTHAVLTAIKMTSEGTRSWIETIMADHGIGWRDAEKVEQYIGERLSSAGLRLVVQEASDNLPETWRVESANVHVVKSDDEIGKRVMEAIRERTKEAINESLSKTGEEAESLKNKLLKELGEEKYGAWAHEPKIEQLWMAYNPNGISQLIAEKNRNLRKRRNLKVHVRSKVAIIGAKDDIYMPDPGVEISPIDTKEIFEQALLGARDKNVREFLRKFIDSGMEAEFEEAKEILGYDTEKTETFVVSMNKNKFRQYGVKLVIDEGRIYARRFKGGEYTKGSRVLDQEWEVIFLKACKNVRTDKNERLLRFLVRKNGTAKVDEVIEEIGFSMGELVKASQQLTEKSLVEYGFGIAIDSEKENVFVEKIGISERDAGIIIAEDRMIGLKPCVPQDNTRRDLTKGRERPNLPDHHGHETTSIINYLLTIVRVDKSKKLLELTLQNPGGVDEKEAVELLGGGGEEELTKKIRAFNYALLKKWGHRLVRISGKVVLTKTADDGITEQLLKRVDELEVQQAQKEAEKRQKREAKEKSKEKSEEEKEAMRKQREERKLKREAKKKEKEERKERRKAAEQQREALKKQLEEKRQAKAKERAEALAKTEAEAKRRAEQRAKTEQQRAGIKKQLEELKLKDQREREERERKLAEEKARTEEQVAAQRAVMGQQIGRIKQGLGEAKQQQRESLVRSSLSLQQQAQKEEVEVEKITIFAGIDGNRPHVKSISINRSAIEKTATRINAALAKATIAAEMEIVGIDDNAIMIIPQKDKMRILSIYGDLKTIEEEFGIIGEMNEFLIELLEGIIDDFESMIRTGFVVSQPSTSPRNS